MSFHVCPECGAENTSYHCDECGRIERTPEQIRLDVLVMQKSTALQTRLSALEAENERLRAKLDAERQVFKERLDELKRDAEHWRKWHDKKKTELDRAYAMAERVRVASGWDGTIDGVNHDVFVLNLRTERNTALSALARVRTPRPLDDWHEDHGNALWWTLTVCEPPYCGTPLDTDWPFDDADPVWTELPLPILTPKEP
jgi:hypothetical protein